MEVVILAGRPTSARVAADAISALLHRKPTRCSVWPPGRPRWRSTTNSSTRCAAGQISFSQVRGFTLDEYVGLPAEHPERYRNVIDKVFVSRVDPPPGAVPALTASPPTSRPRAPPTRNAIRAAGGVDLQILGIGTDGHIGFNEPGSSLASRTSIKTPDQRRPRSTTPASSAMTSTRCPTHRLDAGPGDHHGGPARDPGGHR